MLFFIQVRYICNTKYKSPPCLPVDNLRMSLTTPTDVYLSSLDNTTRMLVFHDLA